MTCVGGQSIFKLQDRDMSQSLHERWQEAWDATDQTTWGALKYCFKAMFWRAGMYKLINSTLQVGSTLTAIASSTNLQYHTRLADTGVSVRCPAVAASLFRGVRQHRPQRGAATPLHGLHLRRLTSRDFRCAEPVRKPMYACLCSPRVVPMVWLRWRRTCTFQTSTASCESACKHGP